MLIYYCHDGKESMKKYSFLNLFITLLSVFEHYRYSGKAMHSEEKEERREEKPYIRRTLLPRNAIKSLLGEKNKQANKQTNKQKWFDVKKIKSVFSQQQLVFSPKKTLRNHCIVLKDSELIF